ncbi:MAG: flagellar export chaperone FlgN [Deltaproteobacteria bacterium]|nr:flagellar export chaperone FlgN [Deltaproteobacteria bacterium]
MESNTQEIEEIYHRKVSLFRELLDCVVLERDNLINLDIKNLWDVMEEKQKILESIENARDQIKDITGEGSPYHNIPIEDRTVIKELSRTLADLNEEIKIRVRENVSFIEDTLSFFNEIISSFTMAGRPGDSYGPGGNSRKGLPNLIYYNEV